MSRRKNACLSLLMATICAGSISLTSVEAAVTSADIVNAIEAAHVFDQAVRLSVRINGDSVDVSTYRDEKENENDRKINAVLVAKAVLDRAGDSISRVTVYFYGKDLSSYQQISVSAGDVKSYGSGQTSRDQLLSSLVLHTGQQQNESDKITSQLQSTTNARPDFKVAVSGGDLAINTTLGDWVSDEEAKLEALKIANSAVQALPPAVTKIKVSFANPRGGKAREIAMAVAEVRPMWSKIQATVAPVAVVLVNSAANIADLQPAAGPLQAERIALLNRLKELEKKGIGIAPFLIVFATIEDGVSGKDEGTIKAAVDHLNRSLDDQEKAFKLAKDSKPTAAVHNGPAKAPPHTSRWVLGDQALPVAEVLNDPDKIVNRLDTFYRQSAPAGGTNPKFLIVLDRVAAILRQNNRAPEATKFEQRANSLRSRAQ